MANINKISDEQIEQALIDSGGQPVEASRKLDVTYPHLYTRIRKNPHLLEVQKAYRSKVFTDLSNTSIFWALTGIVKEPKVNKKGIVIPGEFVERKVDYRTRSGMMQNLMNIYKGDEGIKDTLVIENEGVDLTKLSDSALNELMLAMANAEKEDLDEEDPIDVEEEEDTSFDKPEADPEV